MEEQKEIKEMNQIKQPQWLVNNILLCQKGETCMRSDIERNQHFLQHKEKHGKNKEVFTDGLRSTKGK